MDIEIYQPAPAPATGRTLDARGRGSPWAALLCRSTRVRVAHDSARQAAPCGSRGCLPCARVRLGRFAARLRDARLPDGQTARMLVLTAPVVQSRDDVTRFLASVRGFCEYLQHSGVASGSWVAEVVLRDSPSRERCPVCDAPPPAWVVERIASALRGRRVASLGGYEYADRFDRAALDAAHEHAVYLASECVACHGVGWLPQVHLHAHLVVAYAGRRDWADWWRQWRALTGCETAWLGVDRRPASDPAGYLAKAVSEYVSKAVAVDDGEGVDGVEYVRDLAAASRACFVAGCWYGATRTRGTWGVWGGEPARPVGAPPPAVVPGGWSGEAPPVVAPVARWHDDGASAYAPAGGRWLRPAWAAPSEVDHRPAAPLCALRVLGRLKGDSGAPLPGDADSGPGERPGQGAPGEAPDGCAPGAPGAPPAAQAEGARWTTATHTRRGTARVRVALPADAVCVLTRHVGGDALVVAAGAGLGVPARRGVPAAVLDAAARHAVSAWWDDRERACQAWESGRPAPAPVFWTRRLCDFLTESGYPPVALPRASK